MLHSKHIFHVRCGRLCCTFSKKSKFILLLSRKGLTQKKPVLSVIEDTKLLPAGTGYEMYHRLLTNWKKTKAPYRKFMIQLLLLRLLLTQLKYLRKSTAEFFQEKTMYTKRDIPYRVNVTKFRVVRFLLDTGEYETLATSLPRSITLSEIKELYHARWGIETAFRELKYGIGLVKQWQKYLQESQWYTHFLR